MSKGAMRVLQNKYRSTGDSTLLMGFYCLFQMIMAMMNNFHSLSNGRSIVNKLLIVKNHEFSFFQSAHMDNYIPSGVNKHGWCAKSLSP